MGGSREGQEEAGKVSASAGACTRDENAREGRAGRGVLGQVERSAAPVFATDILSTLPQLSTPAVEGVKSLILFYFHTSTLKRGKMANTRETKWVWVGG